MNRYDQFNAVGTTITAVLMIAWAILRPIDGMQWLQLTAAWFSVTTAGFAWMTAIKGE